MIGYIAQVGCAAAKYEQWLIKGEMYDLNNKNKIIHFADALKDCLSIIYDIPRSYFDNRKYKDELWYVLSEKRFISYEDITRDPRYDVIEISDLYSESLSYIISNKKAIGCIQLRTMMQYFGTLCRCTLSDTIWVENTIRKANTIATDLGFCIIPDVRHAIEASALKELSLYGGLIVVKRGNEIAKHSSENINFIGDYEIDNNGTKMQLFYKVLQFMQNL